MLPSLQLTYLIISWGLVVLIWIIQLVHYPSFHYIDPNKFTDFHKHHTQSITLIVMPLMLSELIIGSLLAYRSGFASIEVIALAMIVGVWLSTFFIQIPLHNQLNIENNSTVVNKLVKTNWIRTFLWTGKAILISC